MILRLRDVAEALQVPESAIMRWIRSEGLPTTSVCGQYRFNPLELVEWSSERAVGRRQLLRSVEGRDVECDLAAALEEGGILQRLAGTDRGQISGELVESLVLPDDFDRQQLNDIFLARGDMGLKSIGDGIAIPLAHSPVILPVANASLTLSFLQTPLPLTGNPGQPIEAFFILICPTMRSHLVHLMHLACALHDPEFRELVKRRASHDHIFRAAHRLHHGQTDNSCPLPRRET